MRIKITILLITMLAIVACGQDDDGGYESLDKESQTSEYKIISEHSKIHQSLWGEVIQNTESGLCYQIIITYQGSSANEVNCELFE